MADLTLAGARAGLASLLLLRRELDKRLHGAGLRVSASEHAGLACAAANSLVTSFLRTLDRSV